MGKLLSLISISLLHIVNFFLYPYYCCYRIPLNIYRKHNDALLYRSDLKNQRMELT
jgi:hypothetical protein